MNEQQKARAEKELLHRILQLLPKIFFVTIATVVVVVSTTQFFKTPKVDFVNVYYEQGALNYEINIDPLDSNIIEDSLNIVLTANNERHVQKGVLGYQANTFDVVLNRAYTLYVEGDIGLGKQRFKEKRIFIKDTPYANVRSFSQVDDTLEVNFTMHNTASITDNKVLVQILSRLETVYYEELDFNNGVNLIIPNIVGDRPYTLRILANIPEKTKLYEQTILTSIMPQINLHYEAMRGLFYYNMRISDPYQRLSGDLEVELSGQGFLYQNKHPISEPEVFGEVMLENAPQGVYTLKVYGLVGFKRTILYQEQFYIPPEASITYRTENNNVIGSINIDSYQIKDYTLFIEYADLSTNETKRIALDETLNFNFEIDGKESYQMRLILMWRGQSYLIDHAFIEATELSAMINTTLDANNVSYNISLNNPSNQNLDVVEVNVLNQSGIVFTNTHQGDLIEGEFFLQSYGFYTLEVVVDNQVIQRKQFFYSPPISMRISSDGTYLNVTLVPEVDLGVDVFIDLYLSNTFIGRQQGLETRFSGLTLGQIYEIRALVIGDEEYVIITDTHAFNALNLSATIQTNIEVRQVFYTLDLMNPNDVAIDSLEVRLHNDLGLVDQTVVYPPFEGSFTLNASGNYTIYVYYLDNLIGSQTLYIPPQATLDLAVTTFSITAQTQITESYEGTIYIDLYQNNTLIERREGMEATFRNLNHNTTYEVVLVLDYNQSYILDSKTHLFNPPLEQEEARILFADYTYNPANNEYLLEVVYEQTFATPNICYLVVKDGEKDIHTIEFTMDETTISVPMESPVADATVHIINIATNEEIASSVLSNRYNYAVIHCDSDSQNIYYTMTPYGPDANSQKVVTFRHILGNQITNTEIPYTLTEDTIPLAYGRHRFEVLMDDIVIAQTDYYLAPTGSLELMDDGILLTASPQLSHPVNEPVYVEVFQNGNFIQELGYLGDALVFSSLPIDTELDIRLVIKERDTHILYQTPYVVSSFFASFAYDTDHFALIWNRDYDLTDVTDLVYTITFEDGQTMDGTINLVSVPSPIYNYDIPYTNTFTKATIVVYATTGGFNRLLGQRTITN